MTKLPHDNYILYVSLVLVYCFATEVLRCCEEELEGALLGVYTCVRRYV